MIGPRVRRAVLALVCCLAAGPAAAGTIVIGQPAKVIDAKFTQAVTLLAQGRLEQADALLQEVLKNDPSQAPALLARVQIAVSERRMADASRTVASALTKNPDLSEAHAMKGVVLLLQRRPEEAAPALRRAVELKPGYATPRFYLAMIARSKGDFAAAATEYQALAQAAPSLPAGYLGQAEALMMLRREPEAFRVLETWKAVPGSGPTPSYVIANIRMARGEPAEAIRELKAVIARSPGDAVVLTLLGDAYLAAGDESHAVENFRAALKVDEGNPVANNNLAWVLAEQGKDLDEALRLAKAACRRDPGYVDALDTLGWIHFRRGEYAEASATLSRASALAPDRLDIAAHLGLAYAKTGSTARALKELRRALAAPTPLPNRAELQRVVAELSSTSR